MVRKLIIVVCLTIVAINPASFAAYVYIDDGVSHIFNDSTYQNDKVWLDYSISNNPGTHVDLVVGGTVTGFSAYNNATVSVTGGTVVGYSVAQDNSSITIADGSVGLWLSAKENATVIMNGGSIGGNLEASDNGTITMTGGTVGEWFTASGNSTITMDGGSVAGYLYASGNGNITMNGGTVSGWLRAFNDSIITMTGGSVTGRLTAWENATIYLEGSNFKVNDTSLQYGDKLSDFATLGNNGYEDYYYGTITGTLTDGSTLNNRFDIFNIAPFPGTGDIIIIPEPCTFLLLGLGVSMLRIKRKT